MVFEEFAKRHYDLFPQCILVVDDEGRIVFVNDSLKNWLGYEKEDVLGKPTFTLPMIRESSYSAIIENFQLRMKGEHVPLYEIELIKETGEVEIAEVSGALIPGDKPHALIILRNVTEEKRILEALEKREREYRFLFEESPVSLWEEDLSGVKRYVEELKMEYIGDLHKYLMKNPAELEKCLGLIKVLRVNKAGLEIYGIEDKNQPPRLEDTFYEESYGPFIEALCAVSEGASRYQNIIWRKKVTGEKILLALRMIAAPGHERTYDKVLVSLTDITENNRIEEKLAKADKLESLGILAGGIAHDFNNILSAIMGNISLAGMEAINPEVRDMLKEAEDAVDKARGLTQQLLTFSRGGAPIMKPANVQEIIEEMTRFSLRGSSVKYEFDFVDDLEFARVDEGQIDQVVNNLVINAVQAMPKGGTIYIQGRNVEAARVNTIPHENGKYIEIGIRDTGTGIEPGIIGKIFDPFFSTKENGNGLGLSSCYSIIKRHGGFIEVNSELGKGTLFLIYLPAYQKSLRKEKPDPCKTRRGKGCILAIDDDEAIRRIYKITLEKLGYRVELAKDGKEGLEKFRQGCKCKDHFDAAIIDLTIPGEGGGSEILKDLKAINPNIRAIVASGYHDNPVVSCYKEYGFVERISKPFTVSQLSQTVSRALQ
jgi:PAS domain S-box-containing protein